MYRSLDVGSRAYVTINYYIHYNIYVDSLDSLMDVHVGPSQAIMVLDSTYSPHWITRWDDIGSLNTNLPYQRVLDRNIWCRIWGKGKTFPTPLFVPLAARGSLMFLVKFTLYTAYTGLWPFSGKMDANPNPVVEAILNILQSMQQQIDHLQNNN